MSKQEALTERSKKPSRLELGPVGKKRRRELERGRRRKERRLWVWRKGGGGFGRDGEEKRIERVLGLGLKKSVPNMGFEFEFVRRSGGLKTDNIGKRDFQSDDTSIFHSLTQNSNALSLKSQSRSWFLSLISWFPLLNLGFSLSLSQSRFLISISNTDFSLRI